MATGPLGPIEIMQLEWAIMPDIDCVPARMHSQLHNHIADRLGRSGRIFRLELAEGGFDALGVVLEGAEPLQAVYLRAA
jgi:hypothetical protein